MEKQKHKARDIKFRSTKSNELVLVHTKEARNYARWLDQQPWVERYEANVPLDKERYNNVNPIDIRASVFQEEWSSDFGIYLVDGRFAVREVVLRETLTKLAAVQRLEFSRRYWAAQGVTDWKIIVLEAGGAQA